MAALGINWSGFVAGLFLGLAPGAVISGGAGLDEGFFGLSYGPFRDGQSPETGVIPNLDEVVADLSILSVTTGRIWFYSSSIENGYTEFVRAATAAPFEFEVVATAYLNPENNRWGAQANEDEIAGLIKLVNNPEIPLWMASVGSEAISSGNASKSDLIARLDQVRAATAGSGVTLTTSETWHTWLDYPDLADHVDVISATIYAYWDGQPVGSAVDYTLSAVDSLSEAFPGKPIVVSESGWPSTGAAQGSAVPSLENAAEFCRGMKAAAAARGIAVFHFSFADEAWKEHMEPLGVGSHFGIMTSGRVAKFDC